jgi:transcriptional regulator with XRE-family HTH domain
MKQRHRTNTVEASSTFGARLRHERERRKISIASIAENTKILGALLEGLENDDVSRWPTGFYRRAFIRAYAGAIGLDPEPVVREFGELYPDPDSVPGAPVTGSASASIAPDPGRDRKSPAVRLAAPEASTWFAPGTLIGHLRFRCLAVAVDVFVLSVMGVGLFAVLGSFWAPLTVAMAVYYFVSILIFGNTPGVCLFAGRAASERTEDLAAPRRSSPVFLLGKFLRRSSLREARASNLG